MSQQTVSDILAEFKPKSPAPREIDLGPMRIEGAGTAWDNGAKKHVLTIRVGDSILSIVSSPAGANVYVIKDGMKLVEPWKTAEAE